jgi:hypothetical protein
VAELILEPYAINQRWRVSAVDIRWEALVGGYLEMLARRCAASDQCVIGHLKALALFPNGGYLRASVVSATLPAGVEGRVPAGCTELVLALNVIVYGLARDLVEHITRETAAVLANRWQGEVTIEAT